MVHATVMEELHLRMTTFTPSEVHKITGVSPVTQRDWRRRGLIETWASDSWTRITTDDVIQLLTMRVLSIRKIPPSFARQLGRMVVLPVLKRLVADAYPNRSVEIEETASALLWIKSLLEQAARERGLEAIEPPLTGNLAFHSGSASVDPRYLIYAEAEADAYQMHTTNSLEEFTAAAASRRQQAGKGPPRYFMYIVVDISNLVQQLLQNRTKPYFEILPMPSYSDRPASRKQLYAQSKGRARKEG